MSSPDRANFIRAHTRLLPVPHVPELRLHVADEATEIWLKTEDELGAMGLPPPFWAFAWAGGQALARYIIDRPEIVRGHTVLDFASGSGLVAIAASRAGAACVLANDIDPFAEAAIHVNAFANKVSLKVHSGDIVGSDRGWDVVLAGDVAYERDMSERVTDWLESLAARGARVLIGDPGRSYLARTRLDIVETYEVPVTRALEDADIKRTSVWRFRSDVDKPNGA